MARCAVGAGLAWLAAASPLGAQSPAAGTPHRLEAAIGAAWLGGASLGSETAELRANRTPAAPFTLFETSSRAESSSGLDARVGFWLTRTVALEAGFVFSRPVIRTRISADAEAAAAQSADERLEQYFFDANVVWLVEPWRITRSTVPFVSGGAGYLRQLHEGRTFVQSGQVYNVGAGVRQLLYLRPTGFLRAAGVRVDGRAYVLVDGVQLDDRPRAHGALSGMVFVTF